MHSEPATDALSTPVAWADTDGLILGLNPAFARWLGVSVRRLLGRPLAALEVQGEALAHFLARDERDSLRLNRLALALPGEAARFAEGWMSRRDDGGWLLEAHPVDEFPGLDPTQALPSALSAALKGLAHELRNPLAGIKGAAQLLLGHRPKDKPHHHGRDWIAVNPHQIAQRSEDHEHRQFDRRGVYADGAKRGLLHIFPAECWQTPALAHITADARPGLVVFTCFHTFPAEQTVVKTLSLLEWREQPPSPGKRVDLKHL